MDFLIHSTVCKHIHLVVISSHSQGGSPFTPPDPTSQPLYQQQHTVSGEQETMEETDSDAGTQTDTEICVNKSQHKVKCDSETDTDEQMEVHAHDVSSLDYLSSQVNNNSKTSTVQDKLAKN